MKRITLSDAYLNYTTAEHKKIPLKKAIIAQLAKDAKEITSITIGNKTYNREELGHVNIEAAQSRLGVSKNFLEGKLFLDMAMLEERLKALQKRERLPIGEIVIAYV